MDGAQIPWRRIHNRNLAIIPERGAFPRRLIKATPRDVENLQACNQTNCIISVSVARLDMAPSAFSPNWIQFAC